MKKSQKKFKSILNGYNLSKCMGYNESIAQNEIYSTECTEERPELVNFYFRKLEEEVQMKTKANRRKKIKIENQQIKSIEIP